jgi:peroxiredoxin Q/BCP
MPDLAAGSAAPAFRLPATSGEVSPEGLTADGRRLVLAFFAEASTPTCTTEIEMLRDAHEMLAEFNAAVLGVSADSLEALHSFANLTAVPFPLASDPSLETARAYGVADEEARRSRRAIFVIDRGIVRLAIAPFQPGNISQVEAIFAVLGAEP